MKIKTFWSFNKKEDEYEKFPWIVRAPICVAGETRFTSLHLTSLLLLSCSLSLMCASATVHVCLNHCSLLFSDGSLQERQQTTSAWISTYCPKNSNLGVLHPSKSSKAVSLETPSCVYFCRAYLQQQINRWSEHAPVSWKIEYKSPAWTMRWGDLIWPLLHPKSAEPSDYELLWDLPLVRLDVLACTQETFHEQICAKLVRTSSTCHSWQTASSFGSTSLAKTLLI